MVQYGLDSFARANQSGFGTASDGQTYSMPRGNQTLSIASNEGLMTYTSSTTAGVVQMGSSSVGDIEMLCRMSQSGNALDLVGLVPRFVDSTHFYTFALGNVSNTFAFIKDVAGTFTTVATVAFTTVVGSFYWMRCRVIGTSFWGKVWADGSPEPAAWQIGPLGLTDSAIAGPGHFGLTGAPRTGDNVKFDSLYVFDYINSDDLSAGDSFLGTNATVFVEANSASDSFLTQGGFVSTDSLSVSDSLLASNAFVPVDNLSALDSFLAQNGVSWTEIVPIADQFTAGGMYLPLDTLNVSDGFSASSVFIPIDQLQAADNLLVVDGVMFLDGLVITDSFSGHSVTPVQVATTVAVVIARGRDGLVNARGRDGNVLARARDGIVKARGH